MIIEFDLSLIHLLIGLSGALLFWIIYLILTIIQNTKMYFYDSYKDMFLDIFWNYK